MPPETSTQVVEPYSILRVLPVEIKSASYNHVVGHGVGNGPGEIRVDIAFQPSDPRRGACEFDRKLQRVVREFEARVDGDVWFYGCGVDVGVQDQERMVWRPYVEESGVDSAIVIDLSFDPEGGLETETKTVKRVTEIAVNLQLTDG